MAYNPYGGPGYGPPPSFGSFPGASGAPGMAPPPGLGPPPGMSSAPGMGPPPGMHQPNGANQANRPSGLPSSFQPPANLPNINFNAPVIRLGASSLPAKPNTPTLGRRDSDAPQSATSARGGGGMDRGLEQQRANIRESMMSTAPPTNEEKLRTIFIHKIPAGVGGEAGIERLLGSVGKLRRWDSGKSHSPEKKGELFGFAQFEDADSLAAAVELLKDIQVPVKKQEPKDDNVEKPENEETDTADIDKVQLKVAVDPNTVKYIEAIQEGREDDAEAEAKARLDTARTALKSILHDMFFPKVQTAQDRDGDVTMGDTVNGDNVEVINIPLAQEDELADIPAEMREVVAQEIAAFRERSNRRDMERLRREEELEEMERQRNGLPRVDRLASPSRNSNNIPLGPRGMANAPAGPRGGQGRGVNFVNGGTNGEHHDDVPSDVDDEELYQSEQARINAESEKQYLEAERKWVNRERQRAAALDREQERDKAEADNASRRQEEQLEREKSWDDEREASRKAHVYYRDHTSWMRKRAQDRAEEEARDEQDRRAEADQRRRHEAEMENANSMADSFLERQAEEMGRNQPAVEEAAPQRFTISFGAAAQKAQASRGPARRTVAEVEGLLDDEEADAGVKRQLIPIKFEPTTAAASMSEEDVAKAVRSLAQEIPTEKDGLWAWDVKWEFMDEGVIADKLRPFVEKKVVEYLGVQEQFLVEVVEEHLRKHGKPGDLVDELEGALDDEAMDLVKKLWRMVIFFTESEKRGLPA